MNVDGMDWGEHRSQSYSALAARIKNYRTISLPVDNPIRRDPAGQYCRQTMSPREILSTNNISSAQKSLSPYLTHNSNPDTGDKTSIEFTALTLRFNILSATMYLDKEQNGFQFSKLYKRDSFSFSIANSYRLGQQYVVIQLGFGIGAVDIHLVELGHHDGYINSCIERVLGLNVRPTSRCT